MEGQEFIRELLSLGIDLHLASTQDEADKIHSDARKAYDKHIASLNNSENTEKHTNKYPLVIQKDTSFD